MLMRIRWSQQVTSPAPSNPSLYLIHHEVLQSIDSCLLGLQHCPVIIVADGFKLDKEKRTKKGATAALKLFKRHT